MPTSDPPTFEVTLAEIIAFVRNETDYPSYLDEHTSLQDKLGVHGDELDDLLLRFAQRFRVDMSGYRWYFHTCEDGLNPFWVLIPPPNKRVHQIPITLAVLLKSARGKSWAVEYPPHRPLTRWDNVALWIALVTVIASIAICCGLRGFR
jgi:hypothetical protein